MTLESTRPQVCKSGESTDHSPQTTVGVPSPKSQVSKAGTRGYAGLLIACGLTVILLLVSTVQAAHFNYRVIAPEMIGEDVYYLQSFLQQLGLYQGELTESYDYDTLSAVKTFQQRHRLPDTGWVDANTANALLSAVNQEASLVVDGQYQLLTPPPIIADGLFYIPVEAAAQVLGIGSESKDDTLLLRFHSQVWPVTIAGQDGVPAQDSAKRATAREWHGTLYLPLRSLATWVGATVGWDGATKTASVELPPDHRPDQASGVHFLRRTATVSYPDRVRLIFYLSSTTTESYTPRRLTYDRAVGNWLGHLADISMAVESYELALNDPTICVVRLEQVKGPSVRLTVTLSAGQQIASCEWLLDLEHDRMILDLYRMQ